MGEIIVDKYLLDEYGDGYIRWLESVVAKSLNMKIKDATMYTFKDNEEIDIYEKILESRINNSKVAHERQFFLLSNVFDEREFIDFCFDKLIEQYKNEKNCMPECFMQLIAEIMSQNGFQDYYDNVGIQSKSEKVTIFENIECSSSENTEVRTIWYGKSRGIETWFAKAHTGGKASSMINKDNKGKYFYLNNKVKYYITDQKVISNIEPYYSKKEQVETKDVINQ